MAKGISNNGCAICFCQAGGSAQGFTISTGCDCLGGTPLDHLPVYMLERKNVSPCPISRNALVNQWQECLAKNYCNPLYIMLL